VERGLPKAYDNRTQARQGCISPAFPGLAQPQKQNSCVYYRCLCSEKQEPGFSCYYVKPLPRSHCSTLFIAIYERPLKEEEEGLFAFRLVWGLLALVFALGHEAFCFLVWEVFRKEKIAKGE
jgi:hypothetical protein